MNDRLIQLNAQLDEAIEFGSGGIKSLRRKLRNQRNEVVRDQGGINYKTHRHDYGIEDDFTPTKRGVPQNTKNRVKMRRDDAKERKALRKTPGPRRASKTWKDWAEAYAE